MKVKQKKNILIISYITALFLLLLGTNLYIKNKTHKLSTQAFNRYNEFFKYQKQFVDAKYDYETVKYSQLNNSEEESHLLLEFLKENFLEENKNMYSYYKINENHNGWQLSIAGRISYRSMFLYNICPTYVVYKKQEYNLISSVEDCVNSAYKFLVSNPKSDFSDYYQNGNLNRINDLISDIPNEYFDFYHSSDYIELFDQVYSYTFNNFYIVFYGKINYQTYDIIERTDEIENDRKNILIIGVILLTAIFLCFLIPFIIQNKRNARKIKENEDEYRKKRNEPIYDQLKNLCNPANFLNPYDKEKVEKSNSIYEQLMNTNCQDIETLKKLRQKAINELNLNFINIEYIQDLKSKCNPERFLKPYNAEKVRVANELYNKLIDNENNIEILEKIEIEMYKKLF